MWTELHITMMLLFMLLISVEPVAAYGWYSSWYIYTIPVFVVIAISSCVGACIRHKHNQRFLEQQRMLNNGIHITGAVNTGYPQYGQNTAYPPPPPGGFVQSPPAYNNQAPATQEKDPNMPPAYDEAVNAPSYPQGGAEGSPYPAQPPQSLPYPTQPSPYPVQQMPDSAYPRQQMPSYPPAQQGMPSAPPS